MRKKIGILLVCMMLLTTFLTVTTYGQKIELKRAAKNVLETSSFEDDVPIWKTGEKWTYKIDEIDIGDITSGHLYLQIGELPLTVEDDTGSEYNLEFNADLDGYFEIVNSTLEIDVKGEFKDSIIEGDISFRKTDLGIEKINVKLSGKLILKVNDLPYIPFPFPKIPFGFMIDIDLDFDEPLLLFDFPLNTNKTWGLHATNITVNGEMSSIWFNIINFINKLVPILPSEIAELLPVINIKEALEMFVGSNIFPISEMPEMFNCSNMEMRTVIAGTFEAYNIIVGGLGSIYYAPEVGNIIEISVDNFKIELKKHTMNVNMGFV